MVAQKRTDTEAKKQRVIDALNSTLAEGGEVSIRGIARAAGVDHVFIQRQEDLRDIILTHSRLMNEGDIYRARGTASLTERQRAFVDRARRGEPMGRYIRQALLEKAARDLGIEDLEDLPELADTARRPAPRRPNRERAAKEQGR
jgi:hypothetical protein